MKYYASAGNISNKVRKNYFKHKGKGHKVIDLAVIRKGIISVICMKYMYNV